VAKKRKPKSNHYFTQDTENAIIAYNKEPNPEIRSEIYRKEIHYALFKLTENIIRTFKFYHTEVNNLEHLQHEIITMLLDRLHKFSPKDNIQDKLQKIIIKEFDEEYTGDFVAYVGDCDRITQSQINSFLDGLDVSEECMEKLRKLSPPKAYSYFGTITKNWLIIYNKTNYQKKIDHAPVDDLYKENSSYLTSTTQSIDKLSFFIDEFISYIESNFDSLFPKGNDAIIADSVLELFRKRENISIFNKKALYIDIREILALSNLEVKTPKITKICDKLYDIFKDNYIFFINHGYIQFEEGHSYLYL